MPNRTQTFLLLVAILGWQHRALAGSPAMPIEIHAAATPAIAAMQDRVYLVAEKQLRSLLPRIHPWSDDPAFLLMTDSKSGEHWIRPNTGMLEGMAFLYRFGPYDEKITGISRADLFTKYILPMMRYCVLTHKTGDRVTSDGKAWGDHWQSAHWSRMLGNAAWWTWDDLPADLQSQVRKLIAYEAERISTKTPPHNLHNDTKCEENAWNSQVFASAIVLMPDDPRRAEWEKQFQRWAMSSHLRPADETSQELVDGRTVAEQFTGANIFDDFTLENHGIVHPDYMSSFSLTLGSMPLYTLTGRKPPEALFHNVAGMYQNLKWFATADGGFVYPNGQDWELFKNPSWVHKHLMMAVYANDAEAWALASVSLTTLEKMQDRFISGEIYPEEEAFFASTRTGIFQSFGKAWLALAFAKEAGDEAHLPLGVLRLDSAKILIQRTPQVINTFSWGAKTMTMCVPQRLDQIVSPVERSGIGRIVIEGDSKPLPIKTSDVRVQNDKESFSAKFIVDHGSVIRANLEVSSNAQGVLTWHEKLVAVKDVTTSEIATGLVGILNNPHWVYENAERHVSFNGDDLTIPSLSGKEFGSQHHDVRVIAIDSALGIHSDRPLQPRYRAARQVERGRATDRLYLNYRGGKRHWAAGQVISEYEARISALW